MEDTQQLDETTIRRLLQENVGMSEYEADVYFALIQKGKQSMKELADVSGVPKQRVYDIVDDLREEGFVELDDSYPKKAYAIEPEETFKPIESRLTTVRDRLQDLHKAVSNIESGVAQFQTLSSITKYVSTLIESAENTIFLLSSRERIALFEEELQGLENTQIRLVLTDIDDLDDSVDNLQALEVVDHVRTTPLSEPFVLSVDRDGGFFWPESSGIEVNVKHEGYYVTNSELAFLFDRFLSDSIWPLANPVEYDEADESTLPGTYYRLQDCLTDLRTITAEQPTESIGIEFDGYDTDTEERVTIRGTLTEFYTSLFDSRAYLELVPESSEDISESTITVGEWNTQTEDYKAYRIELFEEPSWQWGEMEIETREAVDKCLEEFPKEITPQSVAVGFDGYIDHVRHLVGERKSAQMFDQLAHFDSYHEMVGHAKVSDRTLKFEWVEEERIAGGHTAHFTGSVKSLGHDVTSVGFFGEPIRDEFDTLFDNGDALSLGEPTLTEYIYFDDGKIMYTEASPQTLNWEMLQQYASLEQITDALEGVSLVSIGGWALQSGIPTLWEGMSEEVIPNLESPPEQILVCVTEINRLTETTLRSDLESLYRLDDRIPVTLVVTRDQATHLAEVLLPQESGRVATPTIASDLSTNLDVDRVVICSTSESVLGTNGDTIAVRTPEITDPAEEGTLEDHFTAGFGVGLIEDLSPKNTVVLGNAVAGYYKQHRTVPDVSDLREFLETYRDSLSDNEDISGIN